MKNQNMTQYDKGFLQGYRKGYQAGWEAAQSGLVVIGDYSQWQTFPIESMRLSLRAENCLRTAGCICVADVAALEHHAISIMRGLGDKSASEIAQWLVARGIVHTAWDLFL